MSLRLYEQINEFMYKFEVSLYVFKNIDIFTRTQMVITTEKQAGMVAYGTP